MKKTPLRMLECIEALLESYQPYKSRLMLEGAMETHLKRTGSIIHYQWYSHYKQAQDALAKG